MKGWSLPLNVLTLKKEFLYKYVWGNHFDGKYKNKKCRTIDGAKINNRIVLIEFEDGFKTVVSRNSLRRF